ncbi:MAG: hypothetical protein AB7S70_08940 [Hyphomicrobium sp.]
MQDLAPQANGDLSSAEQDLVQAILKGRRAEMRGQTVRAAVLKVLATESRAEWVVPFAGISVHDATIEGALDLEGCSVDKPLVFLRCRFAPHAGERSALSLRDARLKRVALYECVVNGAIKADRAFIDTAFFLTTCTVTGLVRLRGATIGEALAMDSTTIDNGAETAILADGLKLGGPWILRGARITGETRFAGARIGGGLLWEEAELTGSPVAINADGALGEGAWVLRRTKITGSLRARGFSIKAIDAANLSVAASGEAFNGRGADIASDLIFDSARIAGGVLLGRARVGGELSMRGADVSGLGADWAVAGAGLIVEQGVNLAGAILSGGLSLAGARVSQGIIANDVTISSTGRAIEADVLHLGGNWIMRNGKIKGSIRFAGAQIEGQVGFTASQIDGTGDLAIRADGAQIEGGWFMGRAQIRGLVRLPAARVGNEMRLRDTKISVTSGPALFANGVRIARELVLDGGFAATGAIALDHAQVDGTIDLSGSRIVSAKLGRSDAPCAYNYDKVLEERYDELAISLVDARADRLVMPHEADERPRGVIDLSRAHVGSYEDAAVAWPPPARGRGSELRGRTKDGRDVDHLVLDGFLYEHLENPAGQPGEGGSETRRERNAARMRTRWLEGQSSADLDRHFKPQAWMQTARRLSAQGYHDEAREIAIARRRRQRRSVSTGTLQRLQSWLLDVLALYGFNPWRTVIWMAVVVVAFAGMWGLAAKGCAEGGCKDEQVFVMALKGNYGQNDARSVENYPPFSPLAYSFDVFVPFVDFGYEGHWRPRLSYGPVADIALPAWIAPGTESAPQRVTITTGVLLYMAGVLEMILGLVLTSLAVTGFTGMLNTEEDPR